MVKGVGVSRDLNWLLTRNWSSHLVKKRGINRRLSTDPLNPKGLYVPRFQGTFNERLFKLIHIQVAKELFWFTKRSVIKADQARHFQSNC